MNSPLTIHSFDPRSRDFAKHVHSLLVYDPRVKYPRSTEKKNELSNAEVNGLGLIDLCCNLTIKARGEIRELLSHYGYHCFKNDEKLYQAEAKFNEPAVGLRRSKRIAYLSDHPEKAKPKDLQICIDIAKYLRGRRESKSLAIYHRIVDPIINPFSPRGIHNNFREIVTRQIAKILVFHNIYFEDIDNDNSIASANSLKLFHESPFKKSWSHTRDGVINNRAEESILNTGMQLVARGKKQASLCSRFGFETDIDSFLSFVDGKTILDLGSGNNTLAKSLSLLGSTAKVISLNPLMLSPYIRNGAGKVSPKYLNLKAKKGWEDEFQTIDDGTLTTNWTNLKEIPSESIDLILCNSAFPKFSGSNKETETVLSEQYRILKPGAQAWFADLIKNPKDQKSNPYLQWYLENFINNVKKFNLELVEEPKVTEKERRAADKYCIKLKKAG